MSTTEEAFARLLGRQATEPERERLRRVRDVLQLGDNDALWLVVLALEHYDSLFRKYPEALGATTERALAEARKAFAAAAAAEAAKAQRALAERVAETSVQIARKLAAQPVAMTPLTLALCAIIAFGALCTRAGYALGTPAPPFWAVRAPGAATSLRVVSEVLGVPAGWMAFALLLPFMGVVARVGCRVVVDDDLSLRDRAYGAFLAALSVLSAGACIALLWKVL